jgi:superfamily II DNA/RNA helicase
VLAWFLQRAATTPATQPASPVRALVLVPTRELAVAGASECRTLWRRHKAACGAGLRRRQHCRQAEVLQSGVELVIATPGRLLDHLRQGVVSLSSVEVLVLDEADRMLDMGFADEINALLAQLPETRQTLLFSATFNDGVYQLAKSRLQDPQASRWPAAQQYRPRDRAAGLRGG